ncbi:MAG: hypothetical protein AAB605_00165 [Patescibacteria group bacterium]
MTEETKLEVNRAEHAKVVTKFLTDRGVYDFVQILKNDPELLSKITVKQFKLFLDRINGMIQNLPIGERDSYGITVHLQGMTGTQLVPSITDKPLLLELAFKSLPRLKRQEDAMYLLPLMVNALHFYGDGNGRTSRTLHLLLRSHVSRDAFADELKQALGDAGRFDSWNIDPSIINVDIEKIILMRHGIRFKEGNGWNPEMPEGFAGLFTAEAPATLHGQRFNELRKADTAYCFIAARTVLESMDMFGECLTTIDAGKFLSIPMMEIKFGEGGGAWRAVLHEYNKLKMEHVQVMIDMFVRPDAYYTRDGNESLRDHFIREVEQRRETELQKHIPGP